MSAADRSSYTASNVDEAAAGLARAFPDVEVDTGPHGRRFEFQYQSWSTTRFGVNRLRCAGTLSAVGPLPDAVAVGRRQAGVVTIRHDDRSISTDRPYLRPVAPSELRLHDAEVMLITIQPATLIEYFARSGERGSVTSRLVTRPDLSAWELVMDRAADLLDDAAPLSVPGAEEEWCDLLCWSLIRAFPDPWAESRSRRAGPSALQRALQHLEEHADGAVTMVEVADAARVSRRTLNQLFRRELGTTPHRWLQALRLERSRIDLITGSDHIAQIAARHGLPHAGRFAADYRVAYGESPRDTRRRAQQ